MATNKPGKDELIKAITDWVSKASAHASSIGNSENAVVAQYQKEMEQEKEACLQLIENLYSFE